MKEQTFLATEKFLFATAVCEAAGCKQVTLRAWRARNGLFPETKERVRANRFSLLDACMLRTVVVLTEHGLAANDAIQFVQGEGLIVGLDLALKAILDDPAGDSPEIVGFTLNYRHDADDKVMNFDTGEIERAEKLPPPRLVFLRFGDGRLNLADALVNNMGAVTFLDLRHVVRHVLKQLNLKQDAGA